MSVRVMVRWSRGGVLLTGVVLASVWLGGDSSVDGVRAASATPAAVTFRSGTALLTSAIEPERVATTALKVRRDFVAATLRSGQTVACDDSWDCGSAPACDPFTECSVDLYACAVSQQSGLGQCVHRGFCPTCQSLPGDGSADLRR